MKSEENVESILDFAPCTGAWLSWSGSADDEKPPTVQRKRQLERSLGRHAALLALRALCGDSMTQVHIGQDPDGCPIWPQGVVGSISHSQFRAVAVVSHRRFVESIGVDLEKIRTQNSALAYRVLRPEDFQSLLPDMPLYISVSIYFSIRESFYKCLFPILRRPLDWQDCFVATNWSTLTFTAWIMPQSQEKFRKVHGNFRYSQCEVASLCWLIDGEYDA